MSLIATVVLAASAQASGAVLPACSWDKPGANPFMGDVVAAVDRYEDIPLETRAKLKTRMKARSYEDIAVIGRDSIAGKFNYSDDIRDMHFGSGSICRTVTRSKWTPVMQERGLVYCEDGHCILVPTVCRNVSRISRLAPPRAAAPAAAEPDSFASAAPDQGPLNFDAPAAGPLTDGAPGSFAQVAGVSMNSDAGSDGNLVGSFASSVGGQPAGASGAPPPPSLASISPSPFGRARTPGNSEFAVAPIPVVPEPSTWALMGLGLLALVHLARRKR
jgi:PEP-CTERM motif